MVCIYCGHETQVTNSRPRSRQPSVWRRRECLECRAQFSTGELPDYASSFVVRQLDGSLTPFERDELFLSLYRSLGHRPADALVAGSALTATVIAKVLRSRDHGDSAIAVNTIAAKAYQTLYRFDPLAAAQYKAYHQAALKDSKTH
jgi:transcriptional repressor NrdR